MSATVSLPFCWQVCLRRVDFTVVSTVYTGVYVAQRWARQIDRVYFHKPRLSKRRDFFLQIILPNQLSESSLKFVLSFVCVCVCVCFCSMLRSSSAVVQKRLLCFNCGLVDCNCSIFFFKWKKLIRAPIRLSAHSNFTDNRSIYNRASTTPSRLIQLPIAHRRSVDLTRWYDQWPCTNAIRQRRSEPLRSSKDDQLCTCSKSSVSKQQGNDQIQF